MTHITCMMQVSQESPVQILTRLIILYFFQVVLILYVQYSLVGNKNQLNKLLLIFCNENEQSTIYLDFLFRGSTIHTSSHSQETFYTCHQKVCNLPANLYHITPICIDTNSCYITLICIYLYIIINTPNETEYAYSLELELNPTCCRSVLQLVFFLSLYLSFLLINTCK